MSYGTYKTKTVLCDVCISWVFYLLFEKSWFDITSDCGHFVFSMRVTLGKFEITAQTCDNTSAIPNNVVTLSWKNGNSSDGDAHEIKLNTVTLV